MAYEYDHDCPFEAFITNLGKYNEGELVGEWVKFPTTSEELQKVFERIGIGSKDDFGNPYEEWFISDYDCYVDGLYEKLGEYENLDELNYLASKLDELDDHDYNHFQAAMQISDYTGSIKDVINLIDNLDKYEIYPGVESNADLGHYYIEELGMMEVPDYLADYIDYEAYGRDVAINEMGQFTDYGYVRDTQESFTEYYDGDRENIPDEYRVMDFMVSGEKERKTMNYETFKQEFAEDIKEGQPGRRAIGAHGRAGGRTGSTGDPDGRAGRRNGRHLDRLFLLVRQHRRNGRHDPSGDRGRPVRNCPGHPVYR